jgi:hypothetical protein
MGKSTLVLESLRAPIESSGQVTLRKTVCKTRGGFLPDPKISDDQLRQTESAIVNEKYTRAKRGKKGRESAKVLKICNLDNAFGLFTGEMVKQTKNFANIILQHR